MKARGMRKWRERKRGGKRESGVIVGRLTTPHDLIVMPKTAGEAGRRVGGRDASHRILQRWEGGREAGRGEGGGREGPTAARLWGSERLLTVVDAVFIHAGPVECLGGG